MVSSTDTIISGSKYLGIALPNDIINFFELSDKYDTPLKISLFKQTHEYKTLVDSLNIIKKRILQKTMHIKFPVFAREFDITVNVLPIDIYENYYGSHNQYRSHNGHYTLGGFWLHDLPWEKQGEEYGDLFLKMEPSLALGLEGSFSNPKEYIIELYFHLTGELETLQSTFTSILNEDCPTTNNVLLLLKDKTTDKILYSNIYQRNVNSPKHKKKK